MVLEHGAACGCFLEREPPGRRCRPAEVSPQLAIIWHPAAWTDPWHVRTRVLELVLALVFCGTYCFAVALLKHIVHVVMLLWKTTLGGHIVRTHRSTAHRRGLVTQLDSLLVYRQGTQQELLFAEQDIKTS